MHAFRSVNLPTTGNHRCCLGVFFELFSLSRWQLEKYKAPAFVGGPYQIWGLTGYILHRLVNDVIRQHLAVM